MKNGFYAVLAAIGLIIAACGGSKPMTDEQKGKVKEVLGSMNSAVSASKTASQRNGSSTREVGPSDPNQKAMVDKLSTPDCEFDAPGSEMGTAGLNSVSLKVGGPRCPLALEMGFKFEQKGSGIEARLRMFMEIKDAELAKLSDVTKFEINSTITGNDQSGGGPISGSITSKKYGEVKVGGQISANNNESTMEVEYQFSDFSAKLKTVQKADSIEYFLNGEKVSEQDFQATSTGSGAMGGMAAPKPQSQTQTNTSLSYTFSEAGCTTGTRQFSSEQALCQGLQSESLNNGCAQRMRRSYFTSKQCPGTFQVLP